MLICDFCRVHSALGSAKCGRALITADRRLLIATCRVVALSPVRSQTGRGELGLPRLAETIFKIPTCTFSGERRRLAKTNFRFLRFNPSTGRHRPGASLVRRNRPPVAHCQRCQHNFHRQRGQNNSHHPDEDSRALLPDDPQDEIGKTQENVRDQQH